MEPKKDIPKVDPLVKPTIHYVKSSNKEIVNLNKLDSSCRFIDKEC